MPMVRRIVLARVGQHPSADDLVQETLVRVLAALPRIEDGMLEPYAIVTARNVVASMWRDDDRQKRNLHRVVDLHPPERPDEQLVASEEQAAIAHALSQLTDRERETLLAHEVAGDDTGALASRAGLHGGGGGGAAQPHPGAHASRVPAGSGAVRAAERGVPSRSARAVER